MFNWEYRSAMGKQFTFKTIAIDRKTGNKCAVYIDQQSHEMMVTPLADFQSLLSAPASSGGTSGHWSEEEKLSIFRSLFKGRDDVYAKRYFNKRAGRYVYSPTTRFKDGRPMRDKTLPLTDNVIKDHLNGKQFIGVYPLLKDDTTNFLVIDIDKSNWQMIIKSLKKVASQQGVPVFIECSQSGNGGHLWVFFEHTLTAKLARQLGQQLLERAMAINPEISFAAFDRLFPNQDTMPSGGYGNLIAAPLQLERLRQGRSAFIDENFKPYRDQWAYLSTVTKISEKQVQDAIIALASKNTFRLFNEISQTQPDLLADKTFKTMGKIKIIRREQLFLDSHNLTHKQIMTLCWMATFSNPEFYIKQRQRRSTWNSPRYISLATQDSKRYPGYLGLPRGIENLLVEKIPEITWTDKTTNGRSLHVTFTGELFAEQQLAQQSMLRGNMGVLSARTGFGKTVIAASMIAERAVSTLIIVNNLELAEQWQKQLNQFLEIDDDPWTEYTPTGRKRRKRKIGTYYGSRKNTSRLVDIANIQTLARLDALPEFLSHYGMVIIDEVHHVAARTFDEVVSQVPAEYIYGLSATPYRRDGWQPNIFMQVGDIAYQTAKVDERSLLTTKRSLMVRMTNLGELTSNIMANNSLNQNQDAIMNNSDRNQQIIADVRHNYKQGRHIIVLTRRVAHVHQLEDVFKEQYADVKIFVLLGKQKKKNRETVIEINNYQGPYVLLTTTQYAGEGFDVKSLDTLLLAMPVSYKGSVEQYLGRLNRGLDHKSELRVYDYVDIFVPMLARMYRKRLATYKNLHYQIIQNKELGVQLQNGQLGYRELNAELNKSQRTIVIAVSTKQIGLRKLIKKLDNKKIVLVLPRSMRPYYQDLSSVKIIECEATFNVIIIDDEVVWYDYSDIVAKRSEAVSLRFSSHELAKRFSKVLLKTSINLFGGTDEPESE